MPGRSGSDRRPAHVPSPPDSDLGPAVREILSLDCLVTDGGTRVRSVIDDDLVLEYSQAFEDGARFPPVVVFRAGGVDLLSDGFHRVLAFRKVGRTEVEADVYSGGVEDALWFALGANRAHGSRLTRADKRHAVELAYRSWPDISQARIAAHVGCTHQYVSKVRAQHATSCMLPDRVVGADGRTRPATRQSPSSVAAGSPARADGPSGSSSLEGSDNLPADQSNRNIAVLAYDAKNFTTQEDLVDFSALDPAQLPRWIAHLEEGRRRIGRLIRRLRQEVGDGSPGTSVQD